MTSRMSRNALAGAATAVAALGFAASGQAATVAGLVDGKTLVWIDTTAKKVTKTVAIQGGNIVGIDVRPADKQLYGVTSQGKIVIIDAATGKVTDKSEISEKLPAGGLSVDFNPVADRMRIIGAEGTSLRVNVEDGKTTVDGSLKYADADASKGKRRKRRLRPTPTAWPAARKPPCTTSTPRPARWSSRRRQRRHPQHDRLARHEGRWPGRIRHRHGWVRRQKGG